MQSNENSGFPIQSEIQQRIFDKLRGQHRMTATVEALRDVMVGRFCQERNITDKANKLRILVFNTIQQMHEDGYLVTHIHDRDFSKAMIKLNTPIGMLAEK